MSGLPRGVTVFTMSLTGERSQSSRQMPSWNLLPLPKIRKGDLWAGTNGDGLFRFCTRQSVTIFQPMTVCDPISAIVSPPIRNGNIWAGHRLGMSKINPKTGNIRAYSIGGWNYQPISISMPSSPIRKITWYLELRRDWSVYDPSKDQKDTIPPQLNITSLKISDEGL